MLGAERIRRLLEMVGAGPEIEITLEANPENITKPLMREYAAAGINRVSIGIQTLDGALLQGLGRLHDPKVALEAIQNTFEAGIENISVDLMYDLPGQTVASWKNTLEQVVRLPIQHLSLYNLTIEPHTVFFKYQDKIQKQLPDEAASLEMYESAIAAMEGAGLAQYEISAFAKEGRHSHHNVGYWTARPFLGFGPSAFSYWEGRRFRNMCNLSKYCKSLEEGRSPIDFDEKLEPADAKKELLAINMRLISGVDIDDFQRAHGQLDAATLQTLLTLEEEGYLIRKGKRLSLSKRGILFYDTVASEIV